MIEFEPQALTRFHEAAQTLKLYRRAELEDAAGQSLIDKLYVDPLPNDHVLQTMLKANTTFLIGRKGTGKSTVFQRAMRAMHQDRRVMSTYVDIKTVHESAQMDGAMRDKLLASNQSLSAEGVRDLLLTRSFLSQVVAGLRDDMKKQVRSSWTARARDAILGSSNELFKGLDQFLAELDTADFINVSGLKEVRRTEEDLNEKSTTSTSGISVDVGTNPGVTGNLEAATSKKSGKKDLMDYSEILLRTIDIKALILKLREILEPLKVRRLVVFVDDFSELPQVAMQTVVDVLLAPLNNWSNELVKFKIAAYPGRIYYGQIDKTKIDEVSLDMYQLYGQQNVNEMESKAIDFTRRLVLARFKHFKVEFGDYVDPKSEDQVWKLLFFASLGNPRALGYILFFLYDAQLIYTRKINATAVRQAAQRFYEEKIEAYFSLGRFLHESFGERSTIFSLKELLEDVVQRARHLRNYDRSSLMGSLRGRPPTSHFYVPQIFDSLLSTLELNFFITKYYAMSDRDGKRVSVYALNYGLCQKYTLTFGRPDDGKREHRLYFVERPFDYTAIMQGYIASNQEIRCNSCDSIFDSTALDALRMYRMRCPNCTAGTCQVTNISRKYESLLRDVDEQALLSATELGILQTLEVEGRPMFAGEIAGELDCSPQLVGWRAKRLGEKNLVSRRIVKNRREMEPTDLARSIYFSNRHLADLEVQTDSPQPGRDDD